MRTAAILPAAAIPDLEPMRRFILLILLAWLPIQASAMPWVAFRCEQEGSGLHRHAAQPVGHAHESNAVHHHGGGDEDPDTVNGAHSCGHHFSGVANALPMLAGVSVTAGVPPHLPARLHDFIPDLPKRPPLAHLV